MVVSLAFKVGCAVVAVGLDWKTRFLVATAMRDLISLDAPNIARLFNNMYLFLVPALLVYLWLPLLAVGALVTRLFYSIFRATEWAQSFLEQGDKHPLEAIRMVTAALVFAAAVIWMAFS
jgi:hypothetical protein